MTSYGFQNRPIYPVSNPAPTPPIEERMHPLPENERRVVTRADLQNLANKTRSSLLTAGSSSTPSPSDPVYVTPVMARKNIYRKAYKDSKRWSGKNWANAADVEAEKSMRSAQRLRYENLKRERLLPDKVLGDKNWIGERTRLYPFGQEPFDDTINYPILPHPETTISDTGFDALDYVHLDNNLGRRMPLVVDANRGYIHGSGDPNDPNARINIGTLSPYTPWHEFGHYVTPLAKPSDESAGTTVWGRGGDKAKKTLDGNSGYASGQAERLVAVLAEKARMAADFGVDMSTPDGYEKWRQDILSRRGESAPLGNNPADEARKYRDGMNVTSLRSIFYELYDAANDTSLPDVERSKAIERLRQFEDALRYDFPQASNQGGESWSTGTRKVASSMDGKRTGAGNESYESGSGTVESYTPDKTKDHDEIVIRTKDGRRIRISNNTKMGRLLKVVAGDRLNYHGYRVKGTNVVHKVHPNAHSRGGWLEEKTVPDRKMDEETFAEYMSDQLNKKADDASDDETRKIVAKLIAAHWKRRRPWGLRLKNGKFLGNDYFHSRDMEDFDDEHRRKLMENGVVYTGDKAVRANRGICHDLASARLKMLLDRNVKANRLYVDYESPDNPGNVLNHSMLFYKDRNGRYHHANRHIDEPGRLGDYKDMDEAVRDFIRDVIKSKEAKKGEPISIYDTTEVEMPESLPLGEYIRLSKEKGRKVYEQGHGKKAQ